MPRMPERHPGVPTQLPERIQYREVLARPKFGFDPRLVDDLLEAIEAVGVFVGAHAGCRHDVAVPADVRVTDASATAQLGLRCEEARVSVDHAQRYLDGQHQLQLGGALPGERKRELERGHFQRSLLRNRADTAEGAVADAGARGPRSRSRAPRP